MNNGLKTVGDNLSALVRRHPKRLTAIVSAVLLVSTGGAFAVASLGPDVSDVPVREIVEPVANLPLQQQADALAAYRFNLFRTDVTRSSDTAKSLLARLGINDAAAAAFLRSDAKAKSALLGRNGNSVSVEASDDHALLRLTARWSAGSRETFERLVVEKTPVGFTSRVESAPLTASSRLASGTIRSTLFAATDDARIPDAVASQLIEIFSGDVDFQRGLRRGDRFSVVYETLEADGEPLRTGRILSAEFVASGKASQAMWFAEPGKKGAYYTLDGESLQRSFLASPVVYSRISSGFEMRMHPIQKRWKAHLGVDYAATTGTPVRTVGDGVVDFAGVQNGFGNVVFVNHRDGKTTVYAHMSRIDVRKGQTISQGDLVGAVGSTGWVTGPSLHFEFRVNGVYQDPMTIARDNGNSQPISAAARPVFNQLASVTHTQLSAAHPGRQASAQ